MAYTFMRGDRDQPFLLPPDLRDWLPRVRHAHALAGFLVASLKLGAAACMVRVGTVALDGTKLAGNAADTANRAHDTLEAEAAGILKQAAETDQRDDREHGQARGDELPAALASKAGRLARLRQATAQLEAEAAAREEAYQQRVAAHAAAAAPRAQRRARSSVARRKRPTPIWLPEPPRTVSDIAALPLSNSLLRVKPADLALVTPPAAMRNHPFSRGRRHRKLSGARSSFRGGLRR